MKIVSWNVNGLRSAYRKGFLQWLEASQPDLLCLQEVRAFPPQLPVELLTHPPYHITYLAAEKAGYSGVGTWAREKPDSRHQAFAEEGEFAPEGRVLCHEWQNLLLLNLYVPNGRQSDERLRYKMRFYERCRQWCDRQREKGYELIVCGDFNTAHREIDLARPEANRHLSGFLPEECAWLDRWTQAGYIDVFRHLYPDRIQYSWWSMRGGARQRNVGWRLDYFFVTEGVLDNVRDCQIHDDVLGSDHCPISLDLRM